MKPIAGCAAVKLKKTYLTKPRENNAPFLNVFIFREDYSSKTSLNLEEAIRKRFYGIFVLLHVKL